MKLFVSTHETQGQRSNDFCWCEDDELVHWSSECGGETIDGPCGCRRSMAGLVSLKATTTFKVVDRPGYNVQALADVIHRSYELGGWIKPGSWDGTTTSLDEAVEIERVASQFPVGTVLERRGDEIVERTK